MIKTKLFETNLGTDNTIDRQINEFLATNRNFKYIDIKFVTTNTEEICYYAALLVYEEY
ncbi:sporulation protein Cse60 [Priestia aryabhattai]|uniref:sporulation protein Cse60 n=1 Tax=Priestia aryabhattai TaxID=412384 RepID=UPI0015F427FD|nr:sporulation protein Cse60 [Priestia aryabhattai]